MLPVWDLTVPTETKRSLATSEMVFASELLEYLRCLIHGERGSHGDRGGSKLAPCGQSLQKLSFLGLSNIRSLRCEVGPVEYSERDRHRRAADQGEPPEACEGSQQDAYPAQDKEIQGGLPVDPRGYVPFWGRA